MKWLTDEEIKTSPDYITRSQITRSECNKMGIPNYVPVSEVKSAFKRTKGRYIKTGHPFYESQQRHTKYVCKTDLLKSVSGDLQEQIHISHICDQIM